MNAFQSMKQGNCMRVLRLLRDKPRSRVELARMTGLTKAAITGITARLISDGIIREGEITHSEKGRRPTMLEISPESYHSVGIDISRGGVRLCITDLTMRSVYEKEWSSDTDRDTVVEEIVAEINAARNSYRLLGVGVVAPGPVDSENGLILDPRRLDAWHGFSVRELEKRLMLPTVLLKKDTSALALAEKAGTTDNTFLVILADHGIGGGYIYNRRLFEPHGVGCEIGHLCIDPNGPRCSCGSHGCAEVYGSIPSALRHASETFDGICWEELVALARSGDSRAAEILSAHADALATVCVSAVNVLEPSLIFLEGELCLYGEFYCEKIEQALHSRCFSRNGRSVRVTVSSLSHGGRAIAAANLILEDLFEGDDYDRIGRM